jgi:hypothetical protein
VCAPSRRRRRPPEGALREVRLALSHLGVPLDWAEEILAFVVRELPPDVTTAEIVAEVYRRGMQ